jgi:hypothetical protein
MLWDKFVYKRASIACYKIIIIANGQKKCGWIRAFPLVIRDIFTIEGNKDVK